jgi:phosphoribosylglycinamide formyltransferase-1
MSAPPAGSEPLPWDSTPRDVVVLVSGSGTNLQALIDATATPDYGVRIAAVGADRGGIEGLARAQRAGIPTFVCRVEDFATRADWDAALTAEVADLRPWLVVSAGFMKLVGDSFLREFGGRFVNTHPALLPSFPGAHGVRDALAHGVKVTGATLHLVDGGVDTGPIIGQTVVEVRHDDTVDSLHERIKAAEHALLIDCVGRMAREGFTVTNRKVTIP